LPFLVPEGGRQPVDSSEPALNFLGRREFMAKSLLEQVSFVRQPLGRCQTGSWCPSAEVRWSPGETRRSYSPNYGFATSLTNQHPSSWIHL